MKLSTALLLFVLLGQSAFAEVCPFYLTTNAGHSTVQGIYLGSLDTETGKLSPLKLATEAKGPNFLALSPNGKFLFAATGATVASFKIKPDGTLTPINEQPSGGPGACHVSVDHTGRHVFVANYSAGNIAAFNVSEDGLIGERTALMQFAGSGPDPVRQKKPFAHSIYIDPENKFVYSCDLGSDSVWIFNFYSIYASLVPCDPPAAKVPPGSGPRHLAFSPDGKFIYVANEMGNSVSSFARDAATGKLTALETVSTLLPNAPDKGITTAEIFFHPSGKWLYVSNRGHDTIAVFSVDDKGKLKLVQADSSVAEFPRSFSIDPTGHWLIAAGEKGNRIAVLKIDPTTGLLTPIDQTAEAGAPACVLFLPKK